MTPEQEAQIYTEYEAAKVAYENASNEAAKTARHRHCEHHIHWTIKKNQDYGRVLAYESVIRILKSQNDD